MIISSLKKGTNLVINDRFEVLVGTDVGSDIKAGLFRDFSDSADVAGLILVDLALGEAPRGLGPIALDEQNLNERNISGIKNRILYSTRSKNKQTKVQKLQTNDVT